MQLTTGDEEKRERNRDAFPKEDHLRRKTGRSPGMRRADIQQGAFYIGGTRQRIREVLVLLANFEVKWRDIDPETIDFAIWLGVENGGACTPQAFARWAKRRIEPEQVRAWLAVPKARRVQL
jgi:hypothetical protein